MAAATTPDLSLNPPKPREAPFLQRVSRRIEEYSQLARFNRPVGHVVAAMAGAVGAVDRGRRTTDPRVLIVFVLGVIVMRAAGCVINDFADRDIDPHVRRTRDRPIAARRVSPVEALVLFVVLLAIALFLVTFLNLLTIKLAFIGAALTVSYPFVKRVFPMPQLYLGISFGGWSVPMAFAAVTGKLPRVAWVVYIAAVIWAAIYDTIYAMIDREDDLKIGVKSSAILFADMDKALIFVMQAMMIFALVLAGQSMHFGKWYFGGLTAAALLFLYQQWLIRNREPAGCLRAFLNNQSVGMVIFVGILLQYIYARGAG